MASFSPCADDVRQCAFRKQPTCRYGNVGWGCRFITFAPPEASLSQRAKKRLFNNVYVHCRKYGILDCPKFVENRIDEVLDMVK